MADNKEEISGLAEKRAGAAPDEANQRSSSAHNRHSLTKDVKRRSLYDEDSLDGDNSYDLQGRDSVGSGKDTDRVKLVRDRQNEERQRKLEELRQQALAAQRFREQREEERRKRIDELRSRDNDRRNQVEERKRLIWEAERERREAILRKNQEREARIEAKKKNERSHIVFAFGSSTPRMLEPADTGGSTFWGTRRATSTTNVMMFTAAQPLTRRSSERELDGSKKRATSAGGLDRKPGEDMRMSSSMYEVFNWNSSHDHDHPPLTPAKLKIASLSLPPTISTDVIDIINHKQQQQQQQQQHVQVARDTIRPTTQVVHYQRGAATSGEDSDGQPGTPNSAAYLRVNRRRTDLMPTIPSPRDVGSPSSTGRSSSAKAFTRSPGRTYSMSRLDQLSQPRKRPATELSTLAEQQQSHHHHHHHHHHHQQQQQQQQQQNLGASSMSRSMSHLAGTSSATTTANFTSGNTAGNGNGNNNGIKQSLKRSDNSRSMGTLPGSSVVPQSPTSRPTRAERLRRRARDQQFHQQQQQQGIRSGEVTPSSPSRPHSSLSQQSGSSVGSSNVSLRPRTTTPRRPRPASIAGTGVTVTEQRHNFIGDLKVTKDSKPPLPKVHHSTPKKPSSSSSSSSSTQKLFNDNNSATQSPQQQQHHHHQQQQQQQQHATFTTTTTPTSIVTTNVKKSATDKLLKSSKSASSPRVTPKATPLQSPGNEQPPPIIQTNVNVKRDNDTETVKGFDNDEKLDHGSEKTDAQRQESAKSDSAKQSLDDNNVMIDVVTASESQLQFNVDKGIDKGSAGDAKETFKDLEDKETSIPAEDLAPVHVNQQQKNQTESVIAPVANQQTAINKLDKKEEKKNEKNRTPEPESKNDGENDEQVDMTASMIAKTRITTEEEAKAALAERRRLAREQAEREAELERQRIEEEARLEMERQRAEEEEQRRLEEESLRLASEARQAEEQRLRLAIEEAQRREEEDRKRREEEARQKLEKEEAEKKAREEAEKQRIEMAERLKKEEEERIARRKRVEAIMLRTRGKNQPNTPTKGEGGDGDKLLKEDSPVDDVVTAKELSVDKVGDVMTASLISEATENFIVVEQRANDIETNSLLPVDKSSSAKEATTTSSPASTFATTPIDIVGKDSSDPGSEPAMVHQPSSPDLLIRNGDTRSNGVKKNETNGGGGGGGGGGEIVVGGANDDRQSIDDTKSGNEDNTNEINGHNNHSNHDNNRGNNGLNTGNNTTIIDETTIQLDNATVKQNNATNNLLDFSTTDYVDNNSMMTSMSDASSGATIIELTPKLANEDSINSNLNPTAISFNPMANPFVPTTTTTTTTITGIGIGIGIGTTINANNDNTSNPFLQDNFANNKTQDNSQVPDLLS